MPVPGRVYAGGTPFFNEGTGRRTDGIQSPPIMSIPGLPSGPFTPGEGGMSPGQLPTGGPFPGTGGVKPPRPDPRLEPIKQPPIKLPPIISDPMPPPSEGIGPPPPIGPSDDLFGTPGSGSYDNLMSRAFQEYTSGQSPYAGAADFLMNRSVFDRGPRPETSMPSTDMPSYSYSDPGGAGGLAALQAQQPGLQAQYDQFAQQIQSAQEAAQQQAQQQSDMAASERQALMNRIAALESQEGPDLDAFGQQLRQDILGDMPDIDALRREITGEVLSIAQQEFPDVMQIRDEVMRLLPEQEQVDIENLRRQIQESIDRGAPPEQIEALRQELQNRIRPVEEQLQGLQESRGDVAEQIGELRGQVGALPDIDVEQLRQSIISQLPEQERLDIEALQRRIQESIDAGAPEQEIAGLRAELNQRLVPVEERVNSVRESVAQFRQQFDPSSISEQIGNLRGRLESINPATGAGLDFGEIARRVQERLPQDRGVVPPDVLERLRAVEGREGPDLSNIQQAIGELRGRLGAMPGETFDPSALQAQIEEIRGRVQERPDVEQITEQVRGRINPDLMRLRESFDPELARLREESQRIREQQGRLESEASARASARAAELSRLREDQRSQQAASERAIQEVGGRIDPLQERLAQLREAQGRQREELSGRISPLVERIAGLREAQGRQREELSGQISPLAERIAQLRGRLDERPQIDEGALAQRIRESIRPQEIDVDALQRRIQEGIRVPQVDLSGIREQIGRLSGRLDERPQLTSEAVQRMIQERIGAGRTGGIKPQPTPPKSTPKAPPRMGTFPPGYRGPAGRTV